MVWLGAIRRQHDPDVSALALAIRGVGAAPMRPGDRLDDREAEPGAVAAARRVALAEALEGAIDEVGGEARAAVLDVNRHLPIPLARSHGDLAPAVLDRVLHQVGERLLDAQAVTVHRQSVSRLDHDRPPLRIDASREALAEV